jgi:hypothetical protein
MRFIAQLSRFYEILPAVSYNHFYSMEFFFFFHICAKFRLLVFSSETTKEDIYT